MSVHFSSKTDAWSTPQDLFDRLNKEFRFDLDVCADVENAKCKRFFSKEEDGLTQSWTGNCWMNPPYGREISRWVSKARESVESGLANIVVCLLPARTDTKWWHENDCTSKARFLKGRLHFGGHENAAPFPSAVVIFSRLNPLSNHGEQQKKDQSMARKKRENDGTTKTTLQQAIGAGVEKMLDAHYEEAIAYLEEAETQKIKITFGVTVDMTKTEPKVDVGIRFSQAVTDSVSMTLTDINQGVFEEIVKDDGAEPVGSEKGEDTNGN